MTGYREFFGSCLEDVLVLVTDNTCVDVVEDGEVIASYDGKNSIPKELNLERILNISVENNKLIIEIFSQRWC